MKLHTLHASTFWPWSTNSWQSFFDCSVRLLRSQNSFRYQNHTCFVSQTLNILFIKSFTSILCLRKFIPFCSSKSNLWTGFIFNLHNCALLGLASVTLLFLNTLHPFWSLSTLYPFLMVEPIQNRLYLSAGIHIKLVRCFLIQTVSSKAWISTSPLPTVSKYCLSPMWSAILYSDNHFLQ